MNEYVFNGFVDEIEKLSFGPMIAIAGTADGYSSAKDIKEGRLRHKDRSRYARFMARHPVISIAILPGGQSYQLGRFLAGENPFKLTEDMRIGPEGEETVYPLLDDSDLVQMVRRGPRIESDIFGSIKI